MIQRNIYFSYASQNRCWGTTLTAQKLCQSHPWPSEELGAAADPQHRKDEPVPRGPRSSSPTRCTFKAPA